MEAFETVVTFIAVIGAVAGAEVVFNATEAVFLAEALSAGGEAGFVFEAHFVLEDDVHAVGVFDFVLLRGFVWVVSYDIYRAKVFILIAPAVTASYTLFTIHWAVFNIEISNYAALAVIITPLRIDFSSSNISHAALT